MKKFNIYLFLFFVSFQLNAADPVIYYAQRDVSVEVEGAPLFLTSAQVSQVSENYPHDRFEFFRKFSAANRFFSAQGHLLQKLEKEGVATDSLWIVTGDAFFEGFSLVRTGQLYIPRVTIEYQFHLISFSPVKGFKIFGEPELIFVNSFGGIWDSIPFSERSLVKTQPDRWLEHNFRAGSPEYRFFRQSEALYVRSSPDPYHLELRFLDLLNGASIYLPIKHTPIPVSKSWEAVLFASQFAKKCAKAVSHGLFAHD